MMRKQRLLGRKQAAFTVLAGVLILLAVVLAGCAAPAATPSPEDIQTAIAQTQAVHTATLPPTFTPSYTPGPTNTPEPTPTPTPIGPIQGKITTDFLNMRFGPGTMFEIINTFVLDTELEAISRSPDSEWVEVLVEFEDEDPLQGWMYAPLLELDGDPAKLPESAFPDAQTIRGIVKTAEDEPLPGIVISIVLQTDTLDLSAEVTSDAAGQFELYVPEITTDPFHVQIRTFDCDSPVVNLNCLLDGYIILQDEVFLFPAQGEGIEFVFEAAELTLSGNVVNSAGVAVNGGTVQATRDDGAVSYGRSDALGDFDLPISEGIWDVVVITYNPYEESDPVQVEVADEAPEPIEVTLP